MILDETYKSIEIKLGLAVATTEWPIVVSFQDIVSPPTGPGNKNSVSNGTTAVKISGSLQKEFSKRLIKSISIRNKDIASNKCIIQYNDNGTITEIWAPIIAPGTSIFYEAGKGWYCLDTWGAVITPTTDEMKAVTLTNSGANAFVGTIVGLLGYTDQLALNIRFDDLVDGPATANINGFGALDLKVFGNDPLSGPSTGATNNDIKAGQIVIGIVDLPNSRIQIQSPTDNISNAV